MDPEDRPLLSVDDAKPSPVTLTKLVKRLRALTLALLPVEVDPDSINDPTSRVITPRVIKAYHAAAGDFVDALPEFLWDANHNPADYGENMGRATACEVLARRIVHMAPPETLNAIMSTRFQHIQADGDRSDMSSALEMAIDSHCTIFLSSSEAQDGKMPSNYFYSPVTMPSRQLTLAGEIIQKNNANHDIDCASHTSFFGRLDPSRLSVPKYQNMFRIVIWLFFLLVIPSSPTALERSQGTLEFDEWEVISTPWRSPFSLQAAQIVTYKAYNFWMIVAFVTDGILATAFVLRIAGMASANAEQAAGFRLKSFQTLSFAAPLIWFLYNRVQELVTVFDGYKYVGTMQICVARMLQESGIFFALLSVLSLGFGQGLYALDASDGTTESASIVNALVQALLQSPNYGNWGVITCLILLNILISLFSSAYSDVVDDAEAQYLAFFASKTISMIRAPDSYVYPAPFNLIEVFLISPFELCTSQAAYAKLNRFVMLLIFFVPLTMIAFYESVMDTNKHVWMKRWLRGDDEGEDDQPEYRDPEVDDERKISRVPFDELIKAFPNTNQSSEALMLKEILELKKQLAQILEKVGGGAKAEA
ncbi:calcium activated cation channel [Mycena rosella]|uniref:Calcium activated cation channel n=1 Tax=Mycena rosella TaxID=1033263 RepID=A0AAD7D9A3_MYCRO|nr:calcium activated cation channel [Mycena rosella]